MKDML